MLSSLITLAIGAGIGITWNKLDLHKETMEVKLVLPTDYGSPEEIAFTARPKIQSQTQIFGTHVL